MFAQLKAGKAPPTSIIDVEAFVEDLPAPEAPVKNELKAAKRERVEENGAESTPTAEKREVLAQPPSTPEKREVLDLLATQPRLEDTQVSATPAWLREVVEVSASGDVNIEDKALQICDILKSNRNFDPLLSTPRPAESADGDLDDVDDTVVMAEMKAAIEHGVKSGKAPFPARANKLARMWDAALKNNLSLARQHATAPKTHACIASLKLSWLQGVYDEAKKPRISEVTNRSEDTCEGSYLNFAQLVVKLGGGKMGFQAAKNYLEEAQGAASRGETHKGRPFIAWDAWQKMVMILSMETTFKDSHINQKTIKKTQDAIAEPKPPSLPQVEDVYAAENPAPAIAVADKGKGKVKKGKGAGKGKDKDGKDKGKGKGKAETEEKKQAAFAVGWCEKLRKDVARVMHESSELLGAIQKESEWTWARTDASLEALRSGRAALDKCKTSSAFWKEWNVQGYWTRWVRQNMEDSAIIRAVESQKSEWEKAIATVDAEVQRLKRKQLADQPTPKKARR